MQQFLLKNISLLISTHPFLLIRPICSQQQLHCICIMDYRVYDLIQNPTINVPQSTCAFSASGPCVMKMVASILVENSTFTSRRPLFLLELQFQMFCNTYELDFKGVFIQESIMKFCKSAINETSKWLKQNQTCYTNYALGVGDHD